MYIVFSRKQSNLEATVVSLEDQMNTLSEQVAQTNFNASQMMQMMQIILAQQRPRPPQLEITDMYQDEGPDNLTSQS